MNSDEMQAWRYREENPGYQREIPPIVPTTEDMQDADWYEMWQAAQEHTDAENGIIRQSNERTEVARLRSMLEAHGIDPDEG